jgi:ABC-2 type transport system permease protein
MSSSALTPIQRSTSRAQHGWRALRAVVGREVSKFLRQPSRLGSALVRPLLWFLVFAAGFHNVFGVAIIPPYTTYIEYKVYMVPGLLGMIALFNGMQSSLSLVYDREMGIMRLLLTAPLPRSWLLAFKLMAGASLSFLQMGVFLAIAWGFGVHFEWPHLLAALPVMWLGAVLLAAMGLMLSVYVRQLENFAGTMNFVIFPMFFISPALYPLWKLEEAGAWLLHSLAQYNPFTHTVEAIRFALYGQAQTTSLLVLLIGSAVFFYLALRGYDPQRGWMRQRGGK